MDTIHIKDQLENNKPSKLQQKCTKPKIKTGLPLKSSSMNQISKFFFHSSLHTSTTTEKSKVDQVKWTPEKTPNSSRQQSRRTININTQTSSSLVSEQDDLPQLFDSTAHTDGEKNQLHISVQKDPGMNAEVLNKFPTENKSVEYAVKSYDQNISSPFLVTNTEKTKNEVFNDTSLLQSPFLVKNESNNLTNRDLLTMFDLKDIFKESVFYPIKQPYKTGKVHPNNKENLMKIFSKIKPILIKKCELR